MFGHRYTEGSTATRLTCRCHARSRSLRHTRGTRLAVRLRLDQWCLEYCLSTGARHKRGACAANALFGEGLQTIVLVCCAVQVRPGRNASCSVHIRTWRWRGLPTAHGQRIITGDYCSPPLSTTICKVFLCPCRVSVLATTCGFCIDM